MIYLIFRWNLSRSCTFVYRIELQVVGRICEQGKTIQITDKIPLKWDTGQSQRHSLSINFSFEYAHNTRATEPKATIGAARVAFNFENTNWEPHSWHHQWWDATELIVVDNIHSGQGKNHKQICEFLSIFLSIYNSAQFGQGQPAKNRSMRFPLPPPQARGVLAQSVQRKINLNEFSNLFNARQWCSARDEFQCKINNKIII